jgi:hypothetical protein
MSYYGDQGTSTQGRPLGTITPLRHITNGVVRPAGRFSKNKDFATADWAKPEKRSQQRSLSSAIGSENPDEFPLLNFRRDTMQDLSSPQANTQVTNR